MAKRASWRWFCDKVASVPQSARLHRVLTKVDSLPPGLLIKPDKTYSTAIEETLRPLMSGHFPGALDDLYISPTLTYSHMPCNEDWNRVYNKTVTSGLGHKLVITI